jgi:hypothetical protein
MRSWAVALGGHKVDLEDAREMFDDQTFIKVCSVKLGDESERTVLLADDFDRLADPSALLVRRLGDLDEANGALTRPRITLLILSA